MVHDVISVGSTLHSLPVRDLGIQVSGYPVVTPPKAARELGPIGWIVAVY